MLLPPILGGVGRLGGVVLLLTGASEGFDVIFRLGTVGE
jgi:hypothetical protein